MEPDDIEESALPWGLAWRLAVGQLLAWGILFYSFPIVVGPMGDGTGWSRPLLDGGLSVGLLVWGLSALAVGAWIKRRGGRELMTAASLLGGGGLIGLGLVTHPIAYFGIWIVLGFSMAALVYEPAFSVITAAFGSHYQRGLTIISLVAGFASTVFMPLAQLAVSTLGWRGAFMSLGGLLIVVGVPLHFLGIPKHMPPIALEKDGRSVAHKVGQWFQDMRREITDRRFVGLAIWFTALAATFSGITFMLVPMLQDESVDPATYLIALAFLGPTSTLTRLAFSKWGEQFSTLAIGRAALATVVLGVLCLLVLPPTLPGLCLFAILFGAGNGVIPIVRGTAIAEIFGLDRYAELNGAISLPMVFASALTPLTLSEAWTYLDAPRIILWLILGLLAVAAVGAWLTTRAVRQLGSSVHGSG